MLIKLGLRNLKHNLLMNILTILQMSVAFVIFICMISTIVSRFTYYTPIKKLLNSNGYYYNITYGVDPDTNMTIRSSEELSEMIQGESQVIAEYSAWLTYRNNKGEGMDGEFISYDDYYIEILSPELYSGTWIDLNRPVQNTVQVVVSQNNYGIETGDVISLYCMDVEVKAEVVGVLLDDTKIFNPTKQLHENLDYRDIYTNYKTEREEKPVFILSQRDLLDKMVIMQADGNLFITYPENTSKELLEENDRKIRRLHPLFTSSTEEMRQRSLDYIFSQIYNLMPIFICVLILTLVGAISTSALSAKRQLRNYAVYYICGMKWKQCSWVNLFSSVICVVISFVLSIAVTMIAKSTGLLGNTVIELGLWQFLGCAIITLIYILLSMILPISIIGKNTPNQILKSN